MNYSLIKVTSERRVVNETIIPTTVNIPTAPSTQQNENNSQRYEKIFNIFLKLSIISISY